MTKQTIQNWEHAINISLKKMEGICCDMIKLVKRYRDAHATLKYQTHQFKKNKEGVL